jgi:hypothetical protein
LENVEVDRYYDEDTNRPCLERSIDGGEEGGAAVPDAALPDAEPIPLYFGSPDQYMHTNSVQKEFLLGQVVEVTHACTLKTLGIWIEKSNSAELQIALYTDSGGAPDKLVAVTPAREAVVGRNEIEVAATRLVPGDYWVFGVYSTDVKLWNNPDIRRVTRYVRLPFGTDPPAIWPDRSSDYRTHELNYFIGAER